jgi:cell division protein ZipA
MLITLLGLIIAFLIVMMMLQFYRNRSSGESSGKAEYSTTKSVKPDSHRVGYLEPTRIRKSERIITQDNEVHDPDEVLGIKPKSDSDSLVSSVNEQSSVEESVVGFPQEKELVVFRLQAPENRPYSGYELLQSILANGFRYGKMNIFHRFENKTTKGEVLFSLASAVKPGTFDLPNMGGFSTSALTLFINFNAVSDPMKAFEMMLHAAGSLTDDIGGKVLDSSEELLTKEKVREICLMIYRYEQKTKNLDLFSELESEKAGV